MGRPMPAEVAKGGGGDLRWMVRGAWREANPDSSCSGRRAEQARVQYRHEPVGGVSPDLSVSLDDGDLMLIPGEVGGDGRWATPARPDDPAFHSIPSKPSQHGKRPSSTSLPPIHRATVVQTTPEVLPTRTRTKHAVPYSPAYHHSIRHNPPLHCHDILIYEPHMSDSPPPHLHLPHATRNTRSRHNICTPGMSGYNGQHQIDVRHCCRLLNTVRLGLS